jgi:hypothetical protein
MFIVLTIWYQSPLEDMEIEPAVPSCLAASMAHLLGCFAVTEIDV